MPGTHYESKKRWNASNYKQVNVAVRPELADAFRVACEQVGTPMREVLINYMTDYAAMPVPPKKKREKGYVDRGSRRKAVANIVKQLGLIRNAEERYMLKIPENLTSSDKYVSAEQTIEFLDEAVGVLINAFS